MNRKLFGMFSLALVLAVAFSAVAPVAAQAGPNSAKADSVKASFNNGVYLVEMADSPVVAYKGGVPGLKATSPKRDRR